MNSPYIPENNRLDEILSIINNATLIEAVWLLGSAVNESKESSCFYALPPTAERPVHYWLLVAVNDMNKPSLEGVQDKIENRCASIVKVTAIIITSSYYNRWLKEGHPFTSIILKSGVLLSKQDKLLHEQHPPLDERQFSADKQSFYTQGLNKVNEFIVGAELFTLRKQNKMAVFMLHQAVEHSLVTLLFTGMGYLPGTHNLDKLIRYSRLVSPIPASIFNLSTEKDVQLFKLLKTAYIDARYSADYQITEAELKLLVEKVRKMQEFLHQSPM